MNKMSQKSIVQISTSTKLGYLELKSNAEWERWKQIKTLDDAKKVWKTASRGIRNIHFHALLRWKSIPGAPP